MATIAAGPAVSLPPLLRPKREFRWPPGTGPGAVATQNSSAAPIEKSTPGSSQSAFPQSYLRRILTAAEDAIVIPDGDGSDDEDEEDEDEYEASALADKLHASWRTHQTAGGAADATNSPAQDLADGRGSLAAEREPHSEQTPMRESEVGGADRN